MSDPFALLQQVANEGGTLLQVRYVTWNELPNDVVSYVLTLQNMVLTISAQDDDTVEISTGFEVDPEYSIHGSEEYPWSEAIGKPVRWGWAMTNQQGYQDAIQIEFACNVSEPSTIIQLVAVSSSLRLFCVQEKHLAVPEDSHDVGAVG